jgi:hypothetical protein
MPVSITGIIINVIMLIIIVFLVVIGFMFNNQLTICETKQSTFCYTIQCPCDIPNQNNPPCFGYAKMPAETPGQWYCSNAPLSIVDNNGNLI